MKSSRQVQKLSHFFHGIANWLTDAKEVFEVLLSRLLHVSRKYFGNVTEAFILTVSFLFILVKFSVLEAIEKFNGVTTCYIVLYPLPRMCIDIMGFISLPHWTSHTVTWLALFFICHQVQEETFHVPVPSGSFLTFTFKEKDHPINSLENDPDTPNDEIAAESNTKTNNLPRQTPEEISRRQDRQVCFLILKILRILAPVMFVVEGFNAEFGMMIGVSGANHLTTAFMLAVLRHNLLSSPIVWISLAIQVLVAAYFITWVFLDVFILLIGLSSIRLIRHLDAQRTLLGEKREKANQ